MLTVQSYGSCYFLQRHAAVVADEKSLGLFQKCLQNGHRDWLINKQEITLTIYIIIIISNNLLNVSKNKFLGYRYMS